ncbi:uncharacterized protein LOC143362728 [Halictus rubicundus]|uniref:uncharacterized protein LOC143362728 n=1 Tax=Halictus rubicundus TaxID=77578 RepID=UPI004036FBAD
MLSRTTVTNSSINGTETTPNCVIKITEFGMILASEPPANVNPRRMPRYRTLSSKKSQTKRRRAGVILFPTKPPFLPRHQFIRQNRNKRSRRSSSRDDGGHSRMEESLPVTLGKFGFTTGLRKEAVKAARWDIVFQAVSPSRAVVPKSFAQIPFLRGRFELIRINGGVLSLIRR